MTFSPRSRASALIGSMSAGWPYRWTAMIARVLGVMAAAIRPGSRLWVASSGSTGMGVAPACVTASHVAMYVLAGTITSSPGPMP